MSFVLSIEICTEFAHLIVTLFSFIENLLNSGVSVISCYDRIFMDIFSVFQVTARMAAW
jgi:hypothetical protein